MWWSVLRSPPIRRFGKTRFLDAFSPPILCLRRSLLDVTPRPLGQFPFYFYFSWQVVWLAAFRWTLELPIVEKWIFKSSHVSANAQLRDSFHTKSEELG